MKKINFSGGEPFIVKKRTFVGELVKLCKQTLGVESVSIVSNGSLVSERWFEQYGEFLDILAVSCDSFDADTNEKIGRQQGQKSHLISLRSVRRLCADYKVAFKLNTVVNTHNKDENMVEEIMQLNPCRWKCLLIDGENTGPDALRRAESFVITNAEFDEFLRRHKDVEYLVPESNEKRLYNLFETNPRVENVLNFSGFDEKMFFKRGGKYVWSKADMQLDW
ncbi:hypothetical protein DPMN_063823 [Dreissena polymorpha]|uniref:Radical SAM core domain-containing protein n=1 Tax=Dreissena polymorpha TaxID=45954 RepID=A0A9D4CB90_DREPO|nr:hypothetical protein DPMN_063823 [Dreissena polymorpha]